jgi:4-hydroxy-tetrahydrodipicolinate reductase
MSELNIVIVGAAGRMGRTLIESVLATPGARLHAAIDRAGSDFIGQDAGLFIGQQTGVKIASDFAAALSGADVVIDFTRPEATLDYLQHCQQHGVQMIIGTTGFDDAGKAAIKAASEKSASCLPPTSASGST